MGCVWGYNNRNELTSATKYAGIDISNMSKPDADYNYSFDYDHIGNRIEREVEGNRKTAYVSNELNQLTHQFTPSFITVKGATESVATVKIHRKSQGMTPSAFFSPVRTEDGSYSHTFSVDATKGEVTEEFDVYAIIKSADGKDRIGKQTKSFTIPHKAGVNIEPQYDADGNLTSDGINIYTWNAENRLIKVTNTDYTLDFVYDYMGRRIKKTYTDKNDAAKSYTKAFVYNGYLQVQSFELRNSVFEILHSYVWDASSQLLAMVDGDEQYYYLHDANKNVTQLVDSDGIIAANYDYSPFGETIKAEGPMADNSSGDGNPFRFSNEYHDDETGLVYYNYRYYNPAQGKWLSRDSIGERGGINLYGFVGNDGVNGWDELGLKKWSADWNKESDWEVVNSSEANVGASWHEYWELGYSLSLSIVGEKGDCCNKKTGEYRKGMALKASAVVEFHFGFGFAKAFKAPILGMTGGGVELPGYHFKAAPVAIERDCEGKLLLVTDVRSGWHIGGRLFGGFGIKNGFEAGVEYFANVEYLLTSKQDFKTKNFEIEIGLNIDGGGKVGGGYRGLTFWEKFGNWNHKNTFTFSYE